jgi:hypothetical protein
MGPTSTKAHLVARSLREKACQQPKAGSTTGFKPRHLSSNESSTSAQDSGGSGGSTSPNARTCATVTRETLRQIRSGGSGCFARWVIQWRSTSNLSAEASGAPLPRASARRRRPPGLVWAGTGRGPLRLHAEWECADNHHDRLAKVKSRTGGCPRLQPHSPANTRVASTGQRNSAAKDLGWFHPVQGLSRAIVQLPRHGV